MFSGHRDIWIWVESWAPVLLLVVVGSCKGTGEADCGWPQCTESGLSGLDCRWRSDEESQVGEELDSGIGQDGIPLWYPCLGDVPYCFDVCRCDAFGGGGVGVCNTRNFSCSTVPCPCDPDCVDKLPCGSDGYCDWHCPTGVDPDCAGDEHDGHFCCLHDRVCRSEFCPGGADPDCGAVPCVEDGKCDMFCTGFDSDCTCDDAVDYIKSVGYQSAGSVARKAGVCSPLIWCTTLVDYCNPACTSLNLPCSADGYCEERAVLLHQIGCPEDSDPDCVPEGCEPHPLRLRLEDVSSPCSITWANGACEYLFDASNPPPNR